MHYRKVFDSDAGYHSWHAPPLESGETSGETYGCFEVYWEEGGAFKPGWYWAGVRSSKDNTSLEEDPNSAGPFTTSGAAMLDADEFHPDNLDD